MQGQFPSIEDMTVAERALQEMRSLLGALQGEIAQAQQRKKKEQDEEEERKKQAELKAQQEEEQKKSAALSVKEKTKKQGRSRERFLRNINYMDTWLKCVMYIFQQDSITPSEMKV